MSLTESGAPSAPGNHTKGMERLSAALICLPNLAALGATSALMPRARSASATVSEAQRWASSVTATSTVVGTARLTCTRPSPMTRARSRDRPMEMPTPGKVRLPLVARES